MAELVFFRRAEELMRVHLDGRRLTVGRAPANDILVPDPAVSRQQFMIERFGARWRLTDLSGKGTEVAGERVQEVELDDGMDIGLAQWRAVFHRESGGGRPIDVTLNSRLGDTIVQTPADTGAGDFPVCLHIVARDGERVVPIQHEAVIGSGDRATVRIDDPFVSGTHAHLERRRGGFRVVDLQSRNGTYVGAARILEALVPLDCPVRVGATELVLKRAERETTIALFEGMVGNDPALRKIFETIERVAPSQAAVAIFGESGTGKELVARAIHARSERASMPFVPVNCSALSKELVESELFGHEKGAFTGAEKLRKGAFEEADRGTLFLDEIGELPLPLQAKLLRALELGEIKRVGASRPMTVDVRIVAATNRDLRAEVRRGAFREDLYWRLCVVPVQLPPLRARKGDLPLLIRHFLTVHAPSHTPVMLTAEAQAKLAEHGWPGNIRELRNVLHRSLLLRRGVRIEADDILFEVDPSSSPASEVAEAYDDPHSEDLERIYIVGKTLEVVENELFLKTWHRFGGRPTKVAQALGQSRGAVYRRMERLGISTGSEPRDDKVGSNEPREE
ncbi:MAG TPA: sigma 54-interacting transcriptional regulator [Anaeromyxobacteraceae bacterium]|nr:sigma 54-interacting transcriptional regulator [Anaeromyxobacteraceae bacterium]